MKIAYCTAVFPCRSESFLLREIEYMQGQGIDVSVFALVEPPPESRAHIVLSRYPRVVYRPPRWSRLAWRSLLWMCLYRPGAFLTVLRECLRLLLLCPHMALSFAGNLHAIALFARESDRVGIDLIHGYFVNTPGLIAMGVSIVTGKPFTAAGHARDVFVDGRAAPLVCRRAERVVFCNPAAAEEVAMRLHDGQKKKVSIVYHGMDLRATDNHAGRDETQIPPQIVCVGRFVPKKGFCGAIRAIALLRERGLWPWLTLVGDGPEESRLRRLADDLGLSDRVAWPGWLGEDVVQKILGTAAALVVPSVVDPDGDRDGIPNVILEAWAVGTPVVVSNLPGMPEVITHGVHGLLFEPGDHLKLADAIQAAIENPLLRRRLRRNGSERLSETFNIEQNGRDLLDIFKQVSSEPTV